MGSSLSRFKSFNKPKKQGEYMQISNMENDPQYLPESSLQQHQKTDEEYYSPDMCSVITYDAEQGYLIPEHNEDKEKNDEKCFLTKSEENLQNLTPKLKKFQYERDCLLKLSINATEKEKLHLPNIPKIILDSANNSLIEKYTKTSEIKPIDDLFEKVYLNFFTIVLYI